MGTTTNLEMTYPDTQGAGVAWGDSYIENLGKIDSRSADSIAYVNTTSCLTATEVQAAIDEVAAGGGDKLVNYYTDTIETPKAFRAISYTITASGAGGIRVTFQSAHSFADGDVVKIFDSIYYNASGDAISNVTTLTFDIETLVYSSDDNTPQVCEVTQNMYIAKNQSHGEGATVLSRFFAPSYRVDGLILSSTGAGGKLVRTWMRGYVASGWATTGRSLIGANGGTECMVYDDRAGSIKLYNGVGATFLENYRMDFTYVT